MTYTYDRRKTAGDPWSGYDTWKTTPPEYWGSDDVEPTPLDEICSDDVKIEKDMDDVLRDNLADLPQEFVEWLAKKHGLKGVRAPALKVKIKANCDSDYAEAHWTGDTEGYWEFPLRAIANVSFDLPQGLLAALERHTKGKSPKDLAADLIRKFLLSKGGWHGIPDSYTLGPQDEVEPSDFDLKAVKVNVNRAMCTAILTYGGLGKVLWSLPVYEPEPDDRDDDRYDWRRGGGY